MFTCSNKCRSTCLPFQNLTDKVFLDVVIGKRKLPCKSCFRECKKIKKCIKCTICMKWQHIECIPSLSTKRVINLYCSYICSDICEIRTMPFCKMNNDELLNAIICVSPSASALAESTTAQEQPKACVVPNSNSDTTDNHNNCAPIAYTLSHVYCEYINANYVSSMLNEGDPNNMTVFHANAISLKKICT